MAPALWQGERWECDQGPKRLRCPGTWEQGRQLVKDERLQLGVLIRYCCLPQQWVAGGALPLLPPAYWCSSKMRPILTASRLADMSWERGSARRIRHFPDD